MKISLWIAIVLIVIVVIIIVVIGIWRTLEISRYHALKSRQRLLNLDEKYDQLPRVSRHRTIITLTTIPDRVPLLGPTLASLLDQTVKVDDIIINIPYISRKGKKYHIPKWLKRLKSVTIVRVDKDEGPGTKLLPTLRREWGTKTRIIVADDDNIYNSNTIEALSDAFDYYQKRGINAAISNYGLRLDRNGKIPLVWDRAIAMFCKSREVDLLQGFGTFMVTPDMFPEEALEITDCPEEAVSVDDIWFSCWLSINGIPIYSPDYIYKHWPMLNSGDIRLTPALSKNENRAFVTDQTVVDWFIREKGFVPFVAR